MSGRADIRSEDLRRPAARAVPGWLPAPAAPPAEDLGVLGPLRLRQAARDGREIRVGALVRLAGGMQVRVTALRGGGDPHNEGETLSGQKMRFTAQAVEAVLSDEI